MFSQINSQDTVFDINGRNKFFPPLPLFVEAMQFLAQLPVQYLKWSCLSLPLPLVLGGTATVEHFFQLDKLCSLSLCHNPSSCFLIASMFHHLPVSSRCHASKLSPPTEPIIISSFSLSQAYFSVL